LYFRSKSFFFDINLFPLNWNQFYFWFSVPVALNLHLYFLVWGFRFFIHPFRIHSFFFISNASFWMNPFSFISRLSFSFFIFYSYLMKTVFLFRIFILWINDFWLIIWDLFWLFLWIWCSLQFFLSSVFILFIHLRSSRSYWIYFIFDFQIFYQSLMLLKLPIIFSELRFFQSFFRDIDFLMPWFVLLQIWWI
jgi:hypothetical protein